MSETVIVSACLLGINCRYDGANSLDESLIEQIKDSHVVQVCPEQLGGLPTPRVAAEICDGDGFDVLSGRARVVNIEAADVSEQFVKGAKEVLKIAGLVGAKKAYLKEKSPSCGVNLIKCGNLEKSGSGVLAALLSKEGIELFAS
ncbi:MAG: DUF523 domain-containing protein [bacterium]|nr:DUF523 domain-containing protein [bacterium]